jgi:predicted dehydrogenase
VGVVGLGYWGPNLARNFDKLPTAELRWICDASDDARERVASQFPDARLGDGVRDGAARRDRGRP